MTDLAFSPAAITAPGTPNERSLDRAGRGLAAGNLWLRVLCILLLGYALLGKGWAYIGIPPLFVGEAVLLAGVLWLAVSGSWRTIVGSVATWPLLSLAAWGMLCTLPYIGEYGVDALRDAVLWGYGAFALVVYACLLASPERLTLLVRRYQRFAVVFVPGILIVWYICEKSGAAIPNLPWAGVPLVTTKGGDVLVHLAGIFAFYVAFAPRVVKFLPLLFLVAAVGLIGAHSRGGLLSFFAAFAICFLFRPLNRSLWRLILMCIYGLVLLAALDVQFELSADGGKNRPLSFEQLQNNVASVFSDTQAGDLDNTKDWRLRWWGKIIDYTVSGPHFWTGKGFGINLADSDGFQGTAWEGQLRSPHNGHLTMLARSGVPGFLLWILVQATWAWAVLNACRDSRRRGRHEWSGLFLFLFAYWAAFMANASFDVFLEGPMGGIWFWTIYGSGLAAARIYRTSPDAFQPQSDR